MLAGALPAGAAPERAAAEYLLVADPDADAVHVYRARDLRRTGSLDDQDLATHAGTVQLPDGRVIFIDDEAAQVKALRIDDRGRPRIVDSVAIPGDWEAASWAAVDAGLRYFAFSGEGDGRTAPVSVVDLRTFTIDQIQLPLAPDSSGDVAETQVYLAGRPLQLVVTTGGQFRSLPLAPILRGQRPDVRSTAPVGNDTHGPVVARAGDAVYSTTSDGFDGARITGDRLRAPRSVAYSSSRNIVHSYRPRLAADRRTVWGAAAEDAGLAPEQWADTRNHVHLVDLVTFRSRLVRLPDGLTSRLALSRRYAAVSTIHPDGDALTLLDSDRSSPTYRRIVGTVALPSADGGPVAGTPAAGTQGHFVTLNASGSRAYVSNGGDGEITVVATGRRRVVDRIDTPTPLKGGGYLTVVKAGTPLNDLIAR